MTLFRYAHSVKYRLAAAVVVFAAFAFAQTTGKQSPEALLKEAVTSQQNGQFDQAIRNYELFLDMYPDVAEVRSNLAAALVGTGRYADAITEYQRALQKKPDPAVRLNLALAFYKAADFTHAAQELEQVRAGDPNNKQALLLLADCSLRTGDNKKVIELLRSVYLANPSDLGVAYLLGTALARDGQTEQAQQVINQITSRGDSAEVRLLLGTAKFVGRDFHGAIGDLKTAIDMNPNLPDVYSYYGLALLYTGDQAGAQAAFEKELQHNPNNFDANLRLGFLLRNDEQYDRALPFLERALRVRPGDMSARFQIASLRLAQGKEQWARTELEAIVKEAPSFLEAHVTLATIYFREKLKSQGERERAIVDELNAQRQAQQVAAPVNQ
ncbi:MAG TPA: tetratricopeptide repeat protein [Bryobacteraceae bacterium]|nr:tetratricopeptide repeat protein [Bryobacteraceae bacterium]